MIVQPGGTHSYQHVLNVFTLYETQSYLLQICRLRLIFISIRRCCARQQLLKTRMKTAKSEEMSTKKCCLMPFRSVSLLIFLPVHWKYKAWNKTVRMWMFVSWCENKQSSKRKFQSVCEEERITHDDITFSTYPYAVNRCAFEILIE